MILTTPEMNTLANSEDPDEMQHNAAFHQGLHCLLRLGTEIHHNIENSTCDPLKYKMGSSILIVSLSMGKPKRIQRVIGGVFSDKKCSTLDQQRICLNTQLKSSKKQLK